MLWGPSEGLPDSPQNGFHQPISFQEVLPTTPRAVLESGGPSEGLHNPIFFHPEVIINGGQKANSTACDNT